MSNNLRRLEEYGVHHVEYRFDGSGDDGEIWFSEFKDKEGKEIYKSSSAYPNGLCELLTDMESEAYCAIEESDADWVNNEGGFGELKYDLIDGKWYSSMAISRRYYSSNLVHEHINEPVEEQEGDE